MLLRVGYSMHLRSDQEYKIRQRYSLVQRGVAAKWNNMVQSERKWSVKQRSSVRISVKSPVLPFKLWEGFPIQGENACSKRCQPGVWRCYTGLGQMMGLRAQLGFWLGNTVYLKSASLSTWDFCWSFSLNKRSEICRKCYVQRHMCSRGPWSNHNDVNLAA